MEFSAICFFFSKMSVNQEYFWKKWRNSAVALQDEKLFGTDLLYPDNNNCKHNVQ